MSQITVDDMDPSVVHSGNWAKGGTSNENAGTVSSTTTPGDTLTFKFTGSAVAVYGTLDDTSAGVTTTYALDGGNPIQVVSPAGQGDTYKQLFWKSGVLSNSDHELVVTVTKVNSGYGPGEGTIWFDYFTYTGSQASSSVYSNAASASVSSASSSASSSSSSSSPNGTTSNIGPIIGGVVGAFFLILALLLALFFYRRRRRHLNNYPKEYIDEGPQQGHVLAPYAQELVSNEPHIFPFTSPGITPQTWQNFTYTDVPPPSSQPSTIAYTGPFAQAVATPTSPQLGNLAPNTAISAPQSVISSSSVATPWTAGHGTSTSAGAGTRTQSDVKRRPRELATSFDSGSTLPHQHTDSGIRANSSDVDPATIMELPPVYTPD